MHQDLSSLIHLDEPNVVRNLKLRYAKDLIYTGISSVVVAVNPYKQLNCYSNSFIDKYANKAKYEKGLPHVFNIAEDAYRQLLWTGLNQSMVVCGESGAGKTENANNTSKSSFSEAALTSAKIEQQILSANPILESFGNAKTLLNNNSSRFGKFTKLLFNEPDTKAKDVEGGRIVGSACETYLLEKSRVVFQAPGERNYHIFYQMCAGLDENSLNELGIESAEDFAYLNQIDCIEIPGISDEYRFTELMESLDLLGFDEVTISKMLSVVSAVLHLGNIEFIADDSKTSDSCKIGEDSILLEIDEDDLIRRLTKQSMRVARSVIWKEYSVEQAVSNRDSTAKAIYGSLFDWFTINFDQPIDSETKLDTGLNSALKWIGILDVFGFECFEYNSFEQFCINFTNETLQRYFNYNIMLSEQAEYQREGIFWTPIELPDNKPTLDLINKRPRGIFSLLDTACQMPKADDKIFTQLIFKEHGKHKNLKRMNTNPKAQRKRGGQRQLINGFQILHYAMPVCYDAKEFLVKNADRVHEDSVEVFCTSTSPIVQNLLVNLKGKKSKKRTLGYVFSEQLKNLMKSLNTTKPYFVRCIKPNLDKMAGVFKDKYVGDQLRCGGLIEAIKIIKCGYPTRIQYKALFARYGPSVFSNDRKKMETVNQRDFCEAILKSFNQSLSNFEMGLTKVFFKGQQEELLEDLMRKGGPNWKVPADLVDRIKKHLLRKRILRLSAFMKAYSRWLVRLRRMRAERKWARYVRIQVVISKTMFKTLRRCRQRLQILHLTSILRTALAVQRVKRIRQSVLFMQRHFRQMRYRSNLIETLQSRIQAKRDIQESLAANKVAPICLTHVTIL
eukprot:jgi/Bigna1/45663/e_gw1.135.2.1